MSWIVNTSFRPDHTAGNEAFSSAGRTVNGNSAAIVAHENAAARMAKAKVADSARLTAQATALAAKRKPEPGGNATTMESLQQMRREDDALYRSLRGICRGC